MVPVSLIPMLGSAAHSAILPSLTTGATAFGQSSLKTEPDFVAALVLGGVPDIAVAWTRILRPRGIRLSLQGVFCHNRPQVTYPASNASSLGSRLPQCELADLLLVIDDKTAGAPPTRRAALVQAKMAKGKPSIALRGGDLVQLRLLQHWPPFNFVDKGFSKRSRDFNKAVTRPVAASSGLYGVIDKARPDWQQVATPSIQQVSVSGAKFGDYLAGMADGSKAATGRAAIPGGNDDWSFTVDELLKVTGTSSFTVRSIASSPMRGMTKQAGLVFAFGQNGTTSWSYRLGDYWRQGGGGGSEPPAFFEDSRRQGISSVHIVLEGEGVAAPEPKE